MLFRVTALYTGIDHIIADHPIYRIHTLRPFWLRFGIIDIPLLPNVRRTSPPYRIDQKRFNQIISLKLMVGGIMLIIKISIAFFE
jgi:hypothetical protein